MKMSFCCAQDETRTHTALQPLPPQSSVYTNFTTCARIHFIDEPNWCPEQDSNLHVAKHSHLKRARLPIPPSGLKPVGSDLEKKQEGILLLSKWERKTRLELATPTLARLCSTN